MTLFVHVAGVAVPSSSLLGGASWERVFSTFGRLATNGGRGATIAETHFVELDDEFHEPEELGKWEWRTHGRDYLIRGHGYEATRDDAERAATSAALTDPYWGRPYVQPVARTWAGEGAPAKAPPKRRGAR